MTRSKRLLKCAFACILLTALAAAQDSGSRTLTDVAYTSGAGPVQRLDLFLPAGHDFASVLFIHGGSLTSGDKNDDDYHGVCAPFAQSGVACATMNYRLFPAVKWPAPEQDTASAFSWLKSNIARYGGDPNRIFLFGHSSGCLLASLLATDDTFLHQRGFTLNDIAGVIAMGCRLNNVVDASGATPDQIRHHFETDAYDAAFGSLEALNNAVPANHVSGRMPPFLILIAEEEQIHPPILADAQEFLARARKAGARAEYVVLPGLKHYTAIHNARSTGDPTFQRMLRFVRTSGPAPR